MVKQEFSHFYIEKWHITIATRIPRASGPHRIVSNLRGVFHYHLHPRILKLIKDFFVLVFVNKVFRLFTVAYSQDELDTKLWKIFFQPKILSKERKKSRVNFLQEAAPRPEPLPRAWKLQRLLSHRRQQCVLLQPH